MPSGGCLFSLVAGLLPVVEPRYAAPVLLRCYGLAGVLAAFVEVAVLAVALALLVDRLWLLLLRLSRRYRFLEGLVARVEAARERARGLVEKYEALGLAVFVAAPLPVTGMYTGAAVALLLGLPRRDTALALAAGGAASVALTLLASRAGGIA